MTLLRVGSLPPAPLAAAAAFHADVLPRIDALLDAAAGDIANPLTLVFPPADHTHRGWRLAAIQALARARAPFRVNAVAGDDDAAIAAAQAYLRAAPGVTGQVLALDGTGAGAVLSSPG